MNIMPNRILKESITSSENIDKLTAFQEVVFYRLIVTCDDFGRADARPKLLSSKLFPLKDIDPKDIQDALKALSDADLLVIYTVGGKQYLQMKTWGKHQQIRNKVSKFPAPENADEEQELQSFDSKCNQMLSNAIKCYQSQSNVPVIQSNPIQYESNTNTESNPIQRENTRARAFSPPSVKDVKEYIDLKGYEIDPEAFVAFYASKGWKVGNAPMKDWKAAVVTWAKRNARGQGASQYNRQASESSAFAFARMIQEGEFKE